MKTPWPCRGRTARDNIPNTTSRILPQLRRGGTPLSRFERPGRAWCTVSTRVAPKPKRLSTSSGNHLAGRALRERSATTALELSGGSHDHPPIRGAGHQAQQRRRRRLQRLCRREGRPVDRAPAGRDRMRGKDRSRANGRLPRRSAASKAGIMSTSPLRQPCVACRTPVTQHWHRLCRSCWAWHLAGQHLQRYSSLVKLNRGVRA